MKYSRVGVISTDTYMWNGVIKLIGYLLQLRQPGSGNARKIVMLHMITGIVRDSISNAVVTVRLLVLLTIRELKMLRNKMTIQGMNPHAYNTPHNS
eukprot:GHVQ01018020.1.p1 GENE.GHVQ01018020.1~~GHVQ01018020.1.p1  ORF type:complete len:111 (-),score=3.80 GHVQ01018020.1:147-434(-)